MCSQHCIKTKFQVLNKFEILLNNFKIFWNLMCLNNFYKTFCLTNVRNNFLLRKGFLFWSSRYRLNSRIWIIVSENWKTSDELSEGSTGIWAISSIWGQWWGEINLESCWSRFFNSIPHLNSLTGIFMKRNLTGNFFPAFLICSLLYWNNLKKSFFLSQKWTK